MSDDAAAAFRQAIADDPDDDAARFVFADWLEQNNQADRAQWIRLSCQMADLDAARPDKHPRQVCYNLSKGITIAVTLRSVDYERRAI